MLDGGVVVPKYDRAVRVVQANVLRLAATCARLTILILVALELVGILAKLDARIAAALVRLHLVIQAQMHIFFVGQVDNFLQLCRRGAQVLPIELALGPLG